MRDKGGALRDKGQKGNRCGTNIEATSEGHGIEAKGGGIRSRSNEMGDQV
jgi:hypothetical protein